MGPLISGFHLGWWNIIIWPEPLNLDGLWSWSWNPMFLLPQMVLHAERVRLEKLRPNYMFGISHVQKAAWNLVTVTPNTLVSHKYNEQLGNWQLVEFIGHLKLLEKKQHFLNKCSPRTPPTAQPPGPLTCVGNKWLRGSRRTAGVWNATGDQHCWLYAFWLPHQSEPVLQCPK